MHLSFIRLLPHCDGVGDIVSSDGAALILPSSFGLVLGRMYG